MSNYYSTIKATGLYGDAYLFEDVETLKTLSTEYDNRLDILEPDNTTNKSNISSHTTQIATLTTDNTSSKSRLGVLESDNTTNKSNISTHTTQIASLQLYDTSLNLRLQAIEGTEGSPGDTSLSIPIPPIPPTGILALTAGIATVTAACIGSNGLTAIVLIFASLSALFQLMDVYM